MARVADRARHRQTGNGHRLASSRLPPAYVAYYSSSRTHLSLDKDAPIPRQVASPADGAIVAIPQVGGLHHRYERRAA
jgi:putative transposase